MLVSSTSPWTQATAIHRRPGCCTCRRLSSCSNSKVRWGGSFPTVSLRSALCHITTHMPDDMFSRGSVGWMLIGCIAGNLCRRHNGSARCRGHDRWADGATCIADLHAETHRSLWPRLRGVQRCSDPPERHSKLHSRGYIDFDTPPPSPTPPPPPHTHNPKLLVGLVTELGPQISQVRTGLCG